MGIGVTGVEMEKSGSEGTTECLSKFVGIERMLHVNDRTVARLCWNPVNDCRKIYHVIEFDLDRRIVGYTDSQNNLKPLARAA